MAKRLHPCPFRADELDLSHGLCAHCGHPVVDLRSLTGALTVAAALAAGSAPRLTAELPSAVVRGAAIELPELDGVSPSPPASENENDAHPKTDEEVIRALLTVGGYIDAD